jgi:hypothetical protein
MLAHLPIIILASFPLTTVAVSDTVPKFDIARECRSEGGSQATLERCAADEAQARDELQPQWLQFAFHDKTVCLGEATADGTPSYVELLTCLEMARDVKKLSK